MKLLITGAWKCTSEQLNQIETMGHSVIFMQNEKDELPCLYEEVEGVICNGLFLSHPIEKFTSLRYIQLTSAGFDRVPMDYVQAHRVAIHNARGVYSIPMAEFAISGVLQLYKQSRFFYENQKKSVWEKHRGVLELYGKTVCIVGCGNVGTECAKRFAAFGCKVIGVDLFPREGVAYEKMYALVNFDEALSQSDVVVLTLPLTEATRHMMNDGRFVNMKVGSVLVNIARGAVVDEQALRKALDEKLLGVVLDVFEEEPLSSDNPLWTKENAIITPHNSFVGDGNVERLSRVIFSNLREIFI
jgi:phosphoglycerate dehydrogenase-like enzyme